MSIVQRLKAEIQDLLAEISTIQAECSHPASARKETPGANQGNYDPTVDCYWVDHECGLCEKYWRVYSE